MINIRVPIICTSVQPGIETSPSCRRSLNGSSSVSWWSTSIRTTWFRNISQASGNTIQQSRQLGQGSYRIYIRPLTTVGSPSLPCWMSEPHSTRSIMTSWCIDFLNHLESSVRHMTGSHPSSRVTPTRYVSVAQRHPRGKYDLVFRRDRSSDRCCTYCTQRMSQRSWNPWVSKCTYTPTIFNSTISAAHRKLRRWRSESTPPSRQSAVGCRRTDCAWT